MWGVWEQMACKDQAGEREGAWVREQPETVILKVEDCGGAIKCTDRGLENAAELRALWMVFGAC